MATRTVERTAALAPPASRRLDVDGGHDIRIDGAVGYAVRLIPSGKPLDTYQSCRTALVRVLREIEGCGRDERTLAVDVLFADGRRDLLAAGRRLRLGAEDAVGRPRPEPAPPLR